MDRLKIVLFLIVGPMLSGTLLIVVLSLGWYSWAAIGGATALGLLLTLPVSHFISRRIKRQDPDWNDAGKDQATGILPDPSAPEV